MPLKPRVHEIVTTREVLEMTVTFSGEFGTTVKIYFKKIKENKSERGRLNVHKDMQKIVA